MDGDTFVAKSEGEVQLKLMHNNKVVGFKTLYVVRPDSLKFEDERISAVYDEQVDLPLQAFYKGNPVKFNAEDLILSTAVADAGTFADLTFLNAQTFRNRSLNITAALIDVPEVVANLGVTYYKADETMYDFNNATGGERTLSWLRIVSNSDEESFIDNNKKYNIIDPKQAMDISYTFAVDMKDVPIPTKLEGMIELLPGGDNPDMRPWDFLLQLAERVSELTTVNVEIDFDDNLQVDVSDFRLVHDLFELQNVLVDEASSTLSFDVKWIKRTQPINEDEVTPLIIMTGINLKVKDSAQWDDNKQLNLIDRGVVDYDIYLRSNTLYGVASNPEIQETHGLLPFINPNAPNERGGSFAQEFKRYEDRYVLDRNTKEGWISEDNRLYYYENNQRITGIREVLGYQDEENLYYYSFDVNGVSQGKLTDLFERDGNKYYAINGILKTGWREITSDEGVSEYYYFDPETAIAVDGEYVVDGNSFLFVDNKLVRGAMVKDEIGTKYLWANEYYHNKWFEHEGETYNAKISGYLAEGLSLIRERDGKSFAKYLFAEDTHELLSDFNGLYTDDRDRTYLLENGKMLKFAGLVKVGDAYYYFDITDKAVKNGEYEVSKNNGILPVGTYKFDSSGKLILEDDVVPVDPAPTPTPRPTPNPEPTPIPTIDPNEAVNDATSKNGIIEVDGKLVYYKDGSITHEGLFKFNGSYYYAKKNGELVRSTDYHITMVNGLLKEGRYTFDDQGRIVFDVEPDSPEREPLPEVEEVILNGWHLIQNKYERYYVNNVPLKGLNKIGQTTYLFDKNGNKMLGCTNLMEKITISTQNKAEVW